MEAKEVKIFTDWTLLRGNDIAESLLVKLSQDENELADRTQLDDIVSFERSIHLQCDIPNTNEINKLSTCDINFQILPNYVIKSLTIITDCPKAEIFKNAEKEYLYTVYGDFLDDFDGMQVYRHNIEIQKSELCNNLTIKLIPKTPKIWIYGMEIILQNNPKPFNSNTINLDNVQNMLSNFNQKLSPNAERCKSFIQFMSTNGANANHSSNQVLGGSNLGNTQSLLSMFNKNNSSSPPNVEQLMSIFNSNMDPKLFFHDNTKENKSTSEDDIHRLKEYFDKKILETETKILHRLEKMEIAQNEKFDKILEILESNRSD